MTRVLEYRVTWSEAAGEYIAICPEHPDVTGHSREAAHALQALVDSTRKGRPEWRGECSGSPRRGHSASWLDGRYCSWCGAKAHCAMAKQRIWPLDDLRERMAALCAGVEVSADDTALFVSLIGELHDVCVTYGFFDMPAPQVATDSGEVEITWINIRRKRSVSFMCENEHITMLSLDDARGEDVEEPSREAIADRLEWVTGMGASYTTRSAFLPPR